MEPNKEETDPFKRMADSFTLGLIGVAYAIQLGNKENWIMSSKHYANMGLIESEQKTKIIIWDTNRRQAVWEGVVNALETYRQISSDSTPKMEVEEC